MNIIEATKAAQKRGFNVIAHDYRGGYELLKPTNGRGHMERALYPDGATGAVIFHNHSLGLSDLLAEDWYVLDLESAGNDNGNFEPVENSDTQYAPVEIDTSIKELHGYKVEDSIELVPTGESGYILGFNTKVGGDFDIAMSFFGGRPDAFVCAADIKLLAAAPEPPVKGNRSTHVGAPEPSYTIPTPPRGTSECKFNPAFMESHVSAKFKETVRNSDTKALQVAEIYLVDKRDRGEKVKRRLAAVEHELNMRKRQSKRRAMA